MKLSEILKNADGELIQGSLDLEIKDITIDSRQAGDGVLFAAMVGMSVDAHKFIPSAAEKGCKAFIIEHPCDLPEGVTAFLVKNTREALAVISAEFFGDPSSKFNLVGVTGTNGKTSTTYFVESVLNSINHKTGIIGTVETRIGGVKRDFKFATSTTPDTIDLNRIFAVMADEKVDDVVMEVSSHALELKKVDGVKFDVGVFTNLTQDHLDFHKTMENYCKAKAKLFKMCRCGVVNIDDAWAKNIIADADCKIITVGIDGDADLKAKNIEYHMDRVQFTVCIDGKDEDFTLMVPGRFSVYNALSAIGAAYAMGIPVDEIRRGISEIKGVPGRIQNVPNDRGFNVIVDYAHTPDGLENILKSVREFTKGRIITVFGCGGDRDRTKRPIMGEISARLSDYSVLTSDNPRTEDPAEILKEVEAGVSPVTNKYEMHVDRREGIFAAIKMAQKGDTVVIAGKGHEDYEIFKDRTIHFDDTEVAVEALNSLKQ
jgi:UDP-N-acetylmuramoyl-L-alanyl-D-glutamate--2,6-diaminopimelate ligase